MAETYSTYPKMIVHHYSDADHMPAAPDYIAELNGKDAYEIARRLSKGSISVASRPSQRYPEVFVDGYSVKARREFYGRACVPENVMLDALDAHLSTRWTAVRDAG